MKFADPTLDVDQTLSFLDKPIQVASQERQNGSRKVLEFSPMSQRFDCWLDGKHAWFEAKNAVTGHLVHEHMFEFVQRALERFNAE